jgi:hypothetical protein
VTSVPTDVVPAEPSLWRRFLAFASAQVDTLQAKFPPNRVAAYLGVLLTPAAGAVSIWLAREVPGFAVPAPVLVSAVITGGGAVIAIAYKFIDGCQKDERNRFLEADGVVAREHALRMAALEQETRRQLALINKAETLTDLDVLQPGLLESTGFSAPSPAPEPAVDAPTPPSRPSRPSIVAEPVPPVMPPPAPTRPI